MSATLDMPRTHERELDRTGEERFSHGPGEPAGGRRIAAEQALVAGGQLAAGLGNLAFALVAARLLEPRGFAQLAAFLALYLLVHVPASSLSAGSALTPGLAARARRRAVLIGGAIGLALAAAAIPLSGPAGVPPALLFVLAAGVPAAGWLALERGRLYGAQLHRRAALSLAVEPVIRLAVGIPLLLAAGAVGGAVAVVLGGFAALAITRPFTIPKNAEGPGPIPSSGEEAAPSTNVGRASFWATLAFLGLAIVQNQDVVLANGLLDGAEAGRFAVLSTLGGAAAFATTTVPLVLLPRAARGEHLALAGAIGAAVLLGGAAVGMVALLPDSFITASFGDEYAGVAELAVPYVAAMALFGVARVLVAHRSATGGGAGLVAAVMAVAVVQAAGILIAGDDAAAVAGVTLMATGGLAIVAAAVALPLGRLRVAGPEDRVATSPPREPLDRRVVLTIGGLMLAALVVRLAITRGIWLDEATSITQAQMPLPDLIESLRTSDVHPPLHHLLLWVIAHTAGISELAMRMPSILAGTAMVPVLYLLCRELYDQRAATFAAALAAFAPFLVWYSQEARMYALFMLFAAIAMLGQLRALRRGRPRDWLLWGIATILLLWTQYFGAVFTGVQLAGFAIAGWSLWRAGRPVKSYAAWLVGITALVVVATLPLAQFCLDQFQANQAAGRGFNAPKQAGDVEAGGKEPGVYLALTNFVWAVLGYHADNVMALITSVWPLAILAALMLLGRRGRPMTLYIVACALVPAFVLFGLGVLKPFLFEVRYFAGAVPLLLVLLARAATGWARGRLATAALGVLLVGGFAIASADQQLNGSNPRVYDFEGALKKIRSGNRPGDVLLHQPSYLHDVVNYYAPNVKAGPLEGRIPPDRRRVFLLASFQDSPNNRRAVQAGRRELEKHYELVRTERRPQIRVFVYERKEDAR